MGKAKLSYLIVFGLFFVLISGGMTPGYAQTMNPVSAFPIIVDGAFTSEDEWSDITPIAFISPDTNEGTLFQTSLDDPDANAFTYAALAPTEAEGPVDELYLMYDYFPRTEPFDMPGEFVADIFFPLSSPPSEATTEIAYLPGIPESMQVFAGISVPTEFDIVVQVRLPEIGGPVCPDETGSFDVFFDVFFDVEFVGSELACASDFGIGAAADFCSSPEGDLRGVGDHLCVELEVPLLIPPGFGDEAGPFPEEGLPGFECPEGTCGYSPEPAFWGADVANDLVDPPASAAVFTITPFGGTIVSNVAQSLMAVGGDLIPLDSTMVLVAGTHSIAAWMIPVILSAIGIAIVIARKF